jgi:hypothetical protein
VHEHTQQAQSLPHAHRNTHLVNSSASGGSQKWSSPLLASLCLTVCLTVLSLPAMCNTRCGAHSQTSNRGIHSRHRWAAILLLVSSQAGAGAAAAGAADAATPTLTSTTTTTAPLERLLPCLPNCSDVAWCVANSTCNACLTAVLPLLFNSLSSPEVAEYEGRFLEVLKSTPSCSPTLLTPTRWTTLASTCPAVR